MENTDIRSNELIALSERIEERKYWEEKFSDNFGFSIFPGNFTGNPISRELKKYEFDNYITSKVYRISNNSDHLLFTVLTSILNILLLKYTGNTDICIICPVQKLKEPYKAINSIMILRDSLNQNDKFKDILIKTKQLIIDAERHQKFPVLALLEQMEIPYKESPSVSLLLENIHDEGALDRVEANIIFSFSRKVKKLELNVHFDHNLYTEKIVDQIVNHYQNILIACMENPIELKISDIEFLNKNEIEEIAVKFNNTEADEKDYESWIELFYKQLKLAPSKTAIIQNNNYWTYSKLNEDSNKLAHYLIEEIRLEKNQPVGILMEGQYERIVALVGVLKAGGAFIPLLVDLPENRLKLMINDSNIKIVVSLKLHIRLLNKLQWECDSFDTFLCMDTWDVNSEKESVKSNLMNKELWEHVSSTAIDDITAGGWLSSFTGLPLSRKEMDEYGDNILKKLEPYLNNNMKVLEVGCASGISMYRIAPKVKSYVGTDLSENIVDWNRKLIKEKGINNIYLICKPAHLIGEIEYKDFDIIIINSVIQAFHGHNYLRDVIKNCLKLVNSKGILFLGDIMDLDLKKNLINDLRDFKKNNRDESFKTKLDFSEELFLSRKFFYDLKVDFPFISKIDFSNKIFTIENELTNYRFDVILSIDKTVTIQKVTEKIKKRHDLKIFDKYSDTDISINIRRDNIAYIMYTSGTTGVPRGVIIAHESLNNLCIWNNENFEITDFDKSTQYVGLGFDPTVLEIFPYLIKGGSILLVDTEIKLDMEQINNTYKKHGVTISILPTPICEQFVRNITCCKNLRYLLTGGDELQINYTSLPLVNNYGPTESTVVSTSFKIEAKNYKKIPIGKPIRNTKIFIIDTIHSGKLMPKGTWGEICIGGVSITKGYLNNPELTYEKFILNPLNKTEVLYKTGDIGRWLDDGNIEFQGRKDTQIKIRGFRIELGEIKNVLLNHESIEDVIVLVRDENNDKVICAYITCDDKLRLDDLKAYAGKFLPTYMIPSYFIKLKHIPLTANGKIDRKALPKPVIKLESDYIAPRTQEEKLLVEVWSDVLKVDNIGVTDSFFSLGGDSIKTIRIKSRLSMLGYTLDIKDIFKYPTISDLSSKLKLKNNETSQSDVKGNLPLTPIQHWFFEDQTDLHHFNQSVLLYSAKRLDENKTRLVFEKLQEHHDALRITCKKELNSYSLYNHATDEFPFSMDIYNLENIPDADEKLTQYSQSLQQSLNLENGPLMKLGLFHMPDGDRLLIIIHHLVVDGVSWRIIFEDLTLLYDQQEKVIPLELPLKTTSFKEWSENLKEYSESSELYHEKEYWSRIINTEITVPEREFDSGSHPAHDMGNIQFTLDKITTKELLTQVNEVYHTEINDILLCGLCQSIYLTFGDDKVCISLEGHGREEIFSNVNISRTIGWFTSMYPLILDMESSSDLSMQIRKIKENIRQVPNKGIGYGILKYLSPSSLREDLNFKNGPRIEFNYLGQFDSDIHQMKQFRMAHEYAGNTMSTFRENRCDISIGGMIVGEKLSMNIRYKKRYYSEELVHRLSENYKNSLLAIITHCRNAKRKILTPSDLSYKYLSIKEVESLCSCYDVEDVYRLTPMQEGMLFHALSDSGSPAYFEQASYRIQSKLSVDLMKLSLGELFKRHDILRTNFVQGISLMPLQVVQKEKECGFLYENISTLTFSEQVKYISDYKLKDREKGFLLDKDALMRLSLFRIKDDEYEIIWSSHHILIDGWCGGLLINEFFSIYDSFLNNREIELPAITPYKEYIKWLDSVDKDISLNFWKEYLLGYESKATLPVQKGNIQDYKEEIKKITFSEETTQGLQDLANINKVTLNILLQSVWSVILSRYSGKGDMVFGSVVSGRPTQIPNVESMIGLFINTIPVRIRHSKGDTFTGLLHKVQNNYLSSEPHHYISLAEIQSLSLQKQGLIDHLFIFENYPLTERIESLANQGGKSEKFDLQVKDVEVFSQTNYNLTIIAIPTDILEVSFYYNSNVYSTGMMNGLANHFENVIRKILQNPDAKISEIDILSETEKRQLLYDFNNTESDYPSHKSIHELLDEQALRAPNHKALIYNDGFLTYEQLRKKSNSLAGLLKEKGVERGDIVALLCEKSPEMIIAIFAILKAGAVYLPVSPDYPHHRIGFILKDSNTDFILTQAKYQGRFDKICREIILENAEGFSDHSDFQPERVKPCDLAYIIYTSGTTGAPKGVMIEHHSVINRITWMQKAFPLEAHDVLIQKTSIMFDVSVWELFWWSFVGSSLVMICPGDERDPESLLSSIQEYGVSVIHFVPSMLDVFLSYVSDNGLRWRTNSLKYVFSSGEALKRNHVEKYFEQEIGGTNSRLINLYGPTEATVDVSYFECVRNKVDSTIPIGKPIDNIQLYILNEAMELQPIGVSGELYISGVGLSRGYLCNPELTDRKFVPNPFSSNEKLYKTGDLVRWRVDGNIEFLGRMDSQVKIRGFRIELGEIETCLLKHSIIDEAIVTVHEDTLLNKYLCAYIKNNKSENVNISEIKEFILDKLPHYMLPSVFVKINEIPLTANGKIDRKALPKPVIKPESDYIAPRTQEEKLLVEVWSDVLKVDNIGVTDSFFSLGGDSIKTIRIKSRLSMLGYTLDIKDIFKYPTISDLSSKLKLKNNETSQSDVKGNLPLTPIQHWFFEDQTDLHHFNQSVLLYSAKRLDENKTRLVFEKLQEHHDALRITCKKELNSYSLYNHATDEFPFSMDIYNLENIPDADEKLTQYSQSLQQSLNLENGPLMKLGLFHMPDGDRLLIIIHHLVVDGVSWRIIFEDLTLLYDQQEKVIPLELPLKTTSFKEWSENLKEYSESSELYHEKEYWSRIINTEITVPEREFDSGSHPAHDMGNIQFTLDKITTKELLTQVNEVYHTEINDILLCGLCQSIYLTFGDDKVCISLEGHGREEIFSNVNISRTIGWFTSMYPLILDMESSSDLSMQIRKIKENIRQVPNKGIGYGILKYLSPSSLREDLNFKNGPRIEFNYLGQFDSDIHQMKQFRMAHEYAGNTMSTFRENRCDISIGGMIVGEKLSMNIRYKKRYYSEELVHRLSENYKNSLLAIITHCRNAKRKILTPSDLSYKYLSIKEVESLCSCYDVEDVYRLTPMQEGMLFHALSDSGSPAYFEQASYRIQSKLSVDLMKLSLGELFKRHDILRTNFVQGISLMPLQVVQKEKECGFLYENISTLTFSEQVKYISDYKLKDREKGFLLDKDALMRLSLFRIKDDEYEIIWSSHHILIDGWCRGLLINEFFSIYDSFLNNREIELPAITPYKEYIKWLDSVDKDISLNFWKEYLLGYESKATLPVQKGNIQDYKEEIKKITFSEETTQGLQDLANINKVTLNILLQSVWSVILSRYSGKGDMVFGSVVSGRPTQIPNVESMIGLFINTIPVRIRHSKGDTFTGLLHKVQNNYLSSEPHHYISLAEIQSLSLQKQGLIDHLFIFENYPLTERIESLANQGGKSEKFDLQVKDVEVFSQTNYNLTIIAIPTDILEVSFYYNSNVYSTGMMNGLANHFENVIRKILQNPDAKISEIDILSETEKRQLLYDFNNTESDYPSHKSIHELLDEQALRAPSHKALIYNDGFLTYEQLRKKSNSLAGLLKEKGVERGDIVALLCEKSPEMIIAIFAILKAGAVYLPVSPDYPHHRIGFILKDSNTDFILTQAKYQGRFDKICREIILENAEGFSDHSDFQPERVKPCDLAYIIYTSGTTGAPKGVMIEHHSVINRITWMQKAFPLEAHDVLIQKTSIMFDVSVWELFWWSFVGSSLVMIRPGDERDPESLLSSIQEYGVSVIHFVPSMLDVFLSYVSDNGLRWRTNSLKYVFSSGEALKRNHVEKYFEQEIGGTSSRLINLYGPTEATVDVSYFECVRNKVDSTIPIGKPIDNIQLYILDEAMELQPIGVSGELYISGVGLSRGYLCNPELTDRKFVPNPFSSNEKLYKTGDLVRWRVDGNIEFLGRMDSQVKIRGFRIELGEIETCLLKHSIIDEAIVTVHEDTSLNKYLCAYIKNNKSENVNISEIKEFILDKLPHYMLPSVFVKINEIPLTANGKIDKKALPKPDFTINSEYVPPHNSLQCKLVNLWSELLQLSEEKVGINNNYFDLGGNSINATSLISKILNNLGFEISFADFFKHPTIQELSTYLETLEKKENRQIKFTEKKEYYPITAAQKRLFVVQQIHPDSIAYNLVGRIELGVDFDIKKLKIVIDEITKRYEILRTHFISLNGEIYQVVRNNIKVDIEEYNCDDANSETQIIERFVRPFDLSKLPLFRLAVLKNKNGFMTLFMDIHHIIIDGMSFNILISDVEKSLKGEELSKIKYQYKDYTTMQFDETFQKDLERQKKYWYKELKKDFIVTNIRPDFYIQNQEKGEGEYISNYIDRELTAKIRAYTSKNNISLNAYFLGICKIILSKLTGNEEIVIGSVVTGRKVEDLHRIVGFFVNILPIRSMPDGNKSLKGYLSEINGKIYDMFDNQDCAFNDLISDLRQQSRLKSNSIFDIVLEFNNLNTAEIKRINPERELKFYNKVKTVDFNLLFGIQEFKDDIVLKLLYSKSLYKRKTAEELLAYFIEVSNQVIEKRIDFIYDISIGKHLKEIAVNKTVDISGEFDF